jgi:hypothetical protein
MKDDVQTMLIKLYTKQLNTTGKASYSDIINKALREYYESKEKEAN